jgi:hypothetical protein
LIFVNLKTSFIIQWKDITVWLSVVYINSDNVMFWAYNIWKDSHPLWQQREISRHYSIILWNNICIYLWSTHPSLINYEYRKYNHNSYWECLMSRSGMNKLMICSLLLHLEEGVIPHQRRWLKKSALISTKCSHWLEWVTLTDKWVFLNWMKGFQKQQQYWVSA